MQDEQDRLVAAVAADPRYEALVARRSRLGWTLSAVIFVAFVGYLLLIAFRPALLAQPQVSLRARLALLAFPSLSCASRLASAPHCRTLSAR